MSDIQFNMFGSANSEDYDVMVLVPEVPENKELCKVLCSGYEAILKDFFLDKELNVNICETATEDQDGQTIRYISKVFKGTPDECNNSVLNTYLFHKQYCQILTTCNLERNVPIKVARAFRIILTFLSRTHLRTKIKIALQTKSFSTQYTLLKNFDLNNVPESAIIQKNIEYGKFQRKCAFQMLQVMGLLDGVELYDMYNMYLKYNVLLMPSLPVDLNNLRDMMIDKIDSSDLDWDQIVEV